MAESNLIFNLVHSDTRRDIYGNSSLLDGGKEVSFIRLHPHKAIGGCLHDKDEWFCVLKGEIFYWIGDYKGIAKKGESMKIPANMAHTFMSAEGAIIMEYGITSEEKQLGSKEKSQEHLDFIKKVNEGKYE